MKLVRHTIFLFSLLFIFFNHTSTSQVLSPYFNVFNTDDGLSHNWVVSITQDKYGYIWAATVDGLNRIDGKNIQRFNYDKNNDKGIPENYLRSIDTDKDGNIWIGFFGGVARYDQEKKVFVKYTHNQHNPQSIASNNIQDIKVDRNNNLWLASSDKGVTKINLSNYSYTHFNQSKGDDSDLPFLDNHRMCIDANDNIWLGSYTGGICMIDSKTNKVINPFEEFNKSINKNSIQALYGAPNGDVYISVFNHGLYRYRENKLEKLKLDFKFTNSTINITAIYSDSNDVIFSQENEGLFLMNKKNGQIQLLSNSDFDPHSLPHNSIHAIFQDKEHNLWIGTFAGGLGYFRYPNNAFGTIRKKAETQNTISNNSVTSFEEDQFNKLWVGTDNGGINIFDFKNDKIDKLYSNTSTKKALHSNAILCLYKTRDNMIWCGTYQGGISRINPVNNQIVTYNKLKDPSCSLNDITIGSMFEDSKGRLWLGNWGAGVDIFDPKNGKTEKLKLINDVSATPIHNNFIFKVYKDKSNKIWICTASGLYRIENEEIRTCKHFENDPGNPSSLSNNVQYTIIEDSKGRIWIGTPNGLCRYFPEKNNFKTYNKFSGLLSECIYTIQEDQNGLLWFTTNNGITCFDPENEKFTSYNKADGLQGPIFNQRSIFMTQNGMVCAGGLKGFNYFSPLTIQKYTTPIQLVLDRLILNDQEIASGTDIYEGSIQNASAFTIPPAKSSLIQFDFNGICFTQGKNVKYRYILNGKKTFDKLSSDNMLTLYNLPAGEYELKVQANVLERDYSEEKVIKFTIKRDYSVYLLCGLISLAFLILVVLYVRKKRKMVNG